MNSQDNKNYTEEELVKDLETVVEDLIESTSTLNNAVKDLIYILTGK